MPLLHAALPTRDIILVVRVSDGAILDGNEAAVTAYGYPIEVLRGLPLTRLRAPQTRAEMTEQLARADREGLVFETTHQRRDGTIFPVEVSSTGAAIGGERIVISVIRDISSRRRSQALLAESEALFRSTFEQAAVGVAHVGLDGAWMRVNGRLCIMLGYDESELLATNFQSITHPDDLETDLALVRALLAGERVTYQMEKRYIRKDGAILWANLTVSLLRETDGEPRAFVSIVEDITPRKAAEAALTARTGELESLLTSAPLGLAFFDREHRYLRVNDELARINGIAAPDHIGRTIATLLPVNAKVVDPLLDQVFETGVAVSNVEISGQTPADPGVTHTWLCGFYPVRDSGVIAAVGAWVIDITERKQAEQRLAESEARFRTTADLVPGLMFISSADGRNLFVNESFAAFTGLPRETLLAEGWRRFVHPDDIGQGVKIWEEAVRTTGAANVDYRFRRYDGVWRWHQTRSLPARGADGQTHFWVGICVDIHDRRTAEDSLRQTNEELEARVAERTRALLDAAKELRQEMARREEAQAALIQSQKLEALGQLTGGVAHDFNNVLTGILGSYALIRRRFHDPKLLDLVGHGERAAQQAANLVRQLLTFARRESLKPEILDPAAVLRTVQELVLHAIGPEITLSVSACNDLWPVLADAHQLELALLNLAVNARDAMPEGGALTIEACNADASGRPADLAQGEYVALIVADSGAGIPPEHLDRVTEPFFTTKPHGQGTGLGLATVHGFARQSGGALVIESRVGVGTTARILLPRAAMDAAPALPESRGRQSGCEPAGVLHGDAAILLVEDDDHVRPMLAGLLRELGYSVIEAANAEVAGTLVHLLDKLDLLITDVSMPGADGPMLAARLRTEMPGLPVLFMTGRPPGPALAGEIVLRKPFSDEALGSAVLQLLGRTPAPSPF